LLEVAVYTRKCPFVRMSKFLEALDQEVIPDEPFVELPSLVGCVIFGGGDHVVLQGVRHVVGITEKKLGEKNIRR